MPEAANELSVDIYHPDTVISVVYGAFSAMHADRPEVHQRLLFGVSHCGLVLFAILMMNTDGR